MISTEAQTDGGQSRRDRLFRIIKEQSVLTGDFTLVSGRKSSILFDMKKTMLHPEGANLAAAELYELVKDDGVDFIGGLAMGAIPLVTAICIHSHGKRPIKAFFVREKAKTHGTLNLIDGFFEDGARVVLVDDVTTTGGSVMKAVRTVRDRGGSVSKVVTIVDRQEGAGANLAREEISLVPIFTKQDFRDGL